MQSPRESPSEILADLWKLADGAPAALGAALRRRPARAGKGRARADAMLVAARAKEAHPAGLRARRRMCAIGR